MTALDVLKGARKLLERPGAWQQGSMASAPAHGALERAANGEEASPMDRLASSEAAIYGEEGEK